MLTRIDMTNFQVLISLSVICFIGAVCFEVFGKAHGAVLIIPSIVLFFMAIDSEEV